MELLFDKSALRTTLRPAPLRAIALAVTIRPCKGIDVMALIPMKTASTTGYCDCICNCYNLASLRDSEDGKGYCPACAKDHLELNKGIGLPQLPASQRPFGVVPSHVPEIPETADPPARLR
jgi:hypothetical protein